MMAPPIHVDLTHSVSGEWLLLLQTSIFDMVAPPKIVQANNIIQNACGKINFTCAHTGGDRILSYVKLSIMCQSRDLDKM